MRVGDKITDGSAVMLRQVHPNFFRDGRPSSQVFRPEARDNGLLSVHQEALITAEAAYTNHVAAGFGSCGVVSIYVSECAAQDVGLDVVEAPLSTKDSPPDDVDDPAHAAVDFRNLGGTTSEKRGRKLARMCWVRGFRYEPTAPAVQAAAPTVLPAPVQPAASLTSVTRGPALELMPIAQPTFARAPAPMTQPTVARESAPAPTDPTDETE